MLAFICDGHRVLYSAAESPGSITLMLIEAKHMELLLEFIALF
jgi:hypothetical protein